MKYYTNNRIYNFESKIVSIKENNPGIYEVELEETYFYPEGGGQPADKGTINNIQVFDVQKNNKRVIHFLKSKPETGNATCTIDKEYRDHYMIQHTGQHLISAVLKHELDIDTVSVHLGEGESTIEINRNEITGKELEILEDKVNRLIHSGNRVIYHETDDEGLKKFNIRRESKYSGYIRVVEIEDYDSVPCGGVHLSNLSEIGIIKITGYEKIRGHIRLLFIIGPKAIEDYREKHNTVTTLNQSLSTKTKDIPQAIEKLQNTISDLKMEKKTLVELMVEELKNKIFMEKPKFLLFNNYPGDLIKTLVTTISKDNKNTILIINRVGEKLNWALINSKELDYNLDQFRKEVLPLINGKGGGRKELWQGSGNSKNIDIFIEEYLKRL